MDIFDEEILNFLNLLKDGGDSQPSFYPTKN
jgi:hypothetical protein